MQGAHEKFGRLSTRAHQPRLLSACADTGAQTCTSGPGILRELGISKSYLVSTKHQIKGVTNASLTLLEAVFLHITVGDRTTRQIVYVAEKKKIIIIKKKIPFPPTPSHRKDLEDWICITSNRVHLTYASINRCNHVWRTLGDNV